MKSKHILVVIPFIDSIPTKGFEVLLTNHIDELLKNYKSVDILSLNNLDGRKTNFNHPMINFISVDVTAIDKILGLFVCLFKLFPFQSASFVNSKFINKLNSILNLYNYDQVLCYMSRIYPALELVRPNHNNLPIAVYAIDPLPISYKKLRLNAKYLMLLAYSIEGFLMKKLDKKIINNGDRFALISDSDKNDYLNFLGLSNEKLIDVIPYGVNQFNNLVKFKNRKLRHGIITGSGGYKPNQTALKYILKDIWPIASIESNLFLDIAGSGHGKEIENLANSFLSVNLLGFVKNLDEVLGSANFALCLVSLDVGVQTKVLEAMALGTPVISSSASNRGIQAIHGKSIVVADNPTKVLEYIHKITSDVDFAQQLSENSIKFVRDNFNWNNSSKKLINFLSN